MAPRRKSERTYRYWNAQGWWGDQGGASECVGFSITHWIEDGPVTHRGPAPVVDPQELYLLAQQLDEWDGQDYEGTSVRGGMKAAQQLGFVKNYAWIYDAGAFVYSLLELGPMVIGIDWLAGMMDTDERGLIYATGEVVGGHAILADGINVTKGLVRLKNSWGRSWGDDGFCWIPFDELEYLLFGANGEVALAEEVR
jgi:hypothetical protein